MITVSACETEVNVEKLRQRFACLIAFYVGEMSKGDLEMMCVMDDCLSCATEHKFEETDDKTLRMAARKYAEKICSHGM